MALSLELVREFCRIDDEMEAQTIALICDASRSHLLQMLETDSIPEALESRFDLCQLVLISHSYNNREAYAKGSTTENKILKSMVQGLYIELYQYR